MFISTQTVSIQQRASKPAGPSKCQLLKQVGVSVLWQTRLVFFVHSPFLTLTFSLALLLALSFSISCWHWQTHALTPYSDTHTLTYTHTDKQTHTQLNTHWQTDKHTYWHTQTNARPCTTDKSVHRSKTEFPFYRRTASTIPLLGRLHFAHVPDNCHCDQSVNYYDWWWQLLPGHHTCYWLTPSIIVFIRIRVVNFCLLFLMLVMLRLILIELAH